jgi:hypothetical protein
MSKLANHIEVSKLIQSLEWIKIFFTSLQVVIYLCEVSFEILQFGLDYISSPRIVIESSASPLT